MIITIIYDYKSMLSDSLSPHSCRIASLYNNAYSLIEVLTRLLTPSLIVQKIRECFKKIFVHSLQSCNFTGLVLRLQTEQMNSPYRGLHLT